MGGVPSPRHSNAQTRGRFDVFPSDLLSFHILAHSCAHTKKSSLLFSTASALFAKNTRGGGTSVPRARPYQRRLPRSEPVTSHLFGHPSHCSQTFLVQQLALLSAIFKIPGNNSALPGV
jgi:hypothetical protein